MLVKLGWYESIYDQTINGIRLKAGYQVYVPAIYLHEKEELCYVKIRINDQQEYTYRVSKFLERFRKVD